MHSHARCTRAYCHRVGAGPGTFTAPVHGNRKRKLAGFCGSTENTAARSIERQPRGQLPLAHVKRVGRRAPSYRNDGVIDLPDNRRWQGSLQRDGGPGMGCLRTLRNGTTTESEQRTSAEKDDLSDTPMVEPCVLLIQTHFVCWHRGIPSETEFWGTRGYRVLARTLSQAWVRGQMPEGRVPAEHLSAGPDKR